jgi:hypothetical protein
MFVCCECCVLSGRGLCDELITRPEESYQLRRVVVCDLEKPQEWGGHDPRWVAAPRQKRKKMVNSLVVYLKTRVKQELFKFVVSLVKKFFLQAVITCPSPVLKIVANADWTIRETRYWQTRCGPVRIFICVLHDWLTVLHRSITLFDLQLDAQNSYLFTYNTFIKILYMFRALPCSSSGALRRNCIYAASGIVTICKKWAV